MGNIRTLCRSVIVILIWSGFSALATVYHSDGSAASVQGLQNAVLNGDTITLPAGTFTWTTGVTISKAITLQGAGVGQTIIKDNARNLQLLAVGLVAGRLTRITGIEFRDGGRTPTAAAPGGIIHVDGSNTNGSQFRFDHCKWTDLNGYFVTNTVIGVIDHNTVTVGNKVLEWIYPYGSNWDGKSYGDGAWDEPAGYGSSQWLFIEDNIFTCTRTNMEGSLTDCFNGGRVVVRHNNIVNLVIGNHGTESPGRGRSGRAMDIYNNTIDCNSVNRFVTGNRGGGQLVHDNTIRNCGGSSALSTLSAFRIRTSFLPWGGADGTNAWDKNNPSNPFYSGTASAVGNLTVSVSGNPWTTNQWSGYTIRKTSGAGGFAYIDSNTTNTIKFASSGFGRDLVMSVGDRFVINRVDQSLDQAGVGQSTLISGDYPTPPPGFNQVPEPCYIWNNTSDGAPYNTFSAETSNIKRGIHYFDNTALPRYVPYTYPHPLVSGASPTPTPAPTATPTATPTPSPTSPPSPTPSPSPTNTPSALPNPPSNLTAGPTDCRTIGLNWRDNSTDEDRFFIRNSTDGNNFALYASVSGNFTTYTGTNLTPGASYWFKVQAHNANGYSDYSNTVQVTMPTCATPIRYVVPPQ